MLPTSALRTALSRHATSVCEKLWYLNLWSDKNPLRRSPALIQISVGKLALNMFGRNLQPSINYYLLPMLIDTTVPDKSFEMYAHTPHDQKQCCRRNSNPPWPRWSPALYASRHSDSDEMCSLKPVVFDRKSGHAHIWAIIRKPLVIGPCRA